MGAHGVGDRLWHVLRPWPRATRWARLRQTTYRTTVRAVVSTHLDNGPPVILEGDYLLPGVLDDGRFGPSVRVVFIHEPDRGQIAANLALREPGTPNQDARAHVSWLYSEHLRDEAAVRGIPILAARPWATQLERIVDLLATA